MNPFAHRVLTVRTVQKCANVRIMESAIQKLVNVIANQDGEAAAVENLVILVTMVTTALRCATVVTNLVITYLVNVNVLLVLQDISANTHVHKAHGVNSVLMSATVQKVNFVILLMVNANVNLDMTEQTAYEFVKQENLVQAA